MHVISVSDGLDSLFQNIIFQSHNAHTTNSCSLFRYNGRDLLKTAAVIIFYCIANDIGVYLHANHKTEITSQVLAVDVHQDTSGVSPRT